MKQVGKIFCHVSCNNSYWLYKKLVYFCKPILVPITFLNSVTIFISILVDSLGFSM